MSVAARWARISLALLPLLLLAGCQRAPADPAGAATPTVVGAPVTSTRKATAADRELVRRSAPPVRIEIPAIGVSSALVRLGLNPDGTMQVPGDYGVAGWFTGGPAPGDTGPAVIAGHVDSRSGPAIFHRLGALRPGDAIRVIRADRTIARFVAENVARFPKRAFPTQAVFGPAPDPVLRLITCGGRFDRARRSYVDNVIVTAHLAAS
jgi:sortase (surface protein transpeptidase)